jgi:asparagine synthase (glutamine-hydrolysing)
MALMYAENVGLKPDQAFCFSQSGYLDETISRKIAKDYNIPYTFQSLDGGNYLKYIDKLTELSEGCGLFTGGIHVQYAFENLQNKNFKIVHSGAIGDGILGGFNTAPYRKKPGEFKIVINPKFLPKVKSDFDKVLGLYQSEELFYLRNVAYNRTVLGAQVIQQYAYQTSPFMSKTLLEFAISLPENWKINQHLYLEWLNQCMPNAAKYVWEKTGMKPDAHWKNTVGTKLKKKIINIWNAKITNQKYKTSMYPYEFYFYSSKDIQSYYDNYFKENIWRLEKYPELKSDVEMLFMQKDFFQKSQAVNILAIFKLFFN